jgi:hypothetical protein
VGRESGRSQLIVFRQAMKMFRTSHSLVFTVDIIATIPIEAWRAKPSYCARK